MLGKILLTAIVIFLAALTIRKRSLEQGLIDSFRGQQSARKPEEPTSDSDFRFLAYAFLFMFIGLAAAMYYFQWQEDHEILTITLTRSNQQSSSYEVYRADLGERSFVTTDGRAITIATDERMEIETPNGEGP